VPLLNNPAFEATTAAAAFETATAAFETATAAC